MGFKSGEYGDTYKNQPPWAVQCRSSFFGAVGGKGVEDDRSSRRDPGDRHLSYIIHGLQRTLKHSAKFTPLGSMARLWMTLAMCTAMRSADTVWIGPKQMTVESGQQWLEWQPGKKGSAFVSMPMMPQLIEAIEAVKLTTSEVFLLNAHGRPYKTVATLQERIRRWTKDADLTGRSQHGLRKAMAELLAEAGCSDHQIMAIMAHTQPTTSAIYTAKARRKIMAEVALEKTGRLAFE